MTATFTDSEVFTALCIWEHILETPTEAITIYRENNGTTQLRSDCIDLTKWVEAVFELLPQEAVELVAYDWEVVPEIMAHVTWGHPPPAPDVVAPLVRKSLLQQQWMSLVKQYAKQMYCWDEPLENMDSAVLAFEQGDSPLGYVEMLARNYDLDSYRDLNWGHNPPHFNAERYQLRYKP